ncbi:D-arabinose 5-phosphate isomerase, partial [hydrothermal vent metagenome]
ALLEARGFTEEDFARSHPGGRLGRRLLLLIEDIMHSGDEIPVVKSSASIREALDEITRKGMGMTAVVNDENKVQGIFTDGDLRRILDTDIDIKTTVINDVMTSGCKTANQHILAAEALQILQSHKINGLLIVNHDNILKGAINMHDLLRAGVV